MTIEPGTRVRYHNGKEWEYGEIVREGNWDPIHGNPFHLVLFDGDNVAKSVRDEKLEVFQ